MADLSNLDCLHPNKKIEILAFFRNLSRRRQAGYWCEIYNKKVNRFCDEDRDSRLGVFGSLMETKQYNSKRNQEIFGFFKDLEKSMKRIEKRASSKVGGIEEVSIESVDLSD